MTTMKRMSISLPDEIEQAIVDLRKTDAFCRCSYSEIIRTLIAAGLAAAAEADHTDQHVPQ